MQSRSAFSRAVIYLLLFAGSAVFVLPLVWLLVTSLKPIDQTMAVPPTWVPRAYYAQINGRRVEVTRDFKVPPDSWHVTERSETKMVTHKPESAVVRESELESHVRLRWENYPVALRTIGGRSIEEAEGTVQAQSNGAGQDSNVSFWQFVANTVLVCVLGVIGAVSSNAVVAYGFARIDWRGREPLFALTLATMMIPFPVLMVPLYGVFRSLGWIGTLLPLWVPAFFGSAFNIFLMRQFFRTIPKDLSEAAVIDGCNEWQIFWHVILPLSKPVLSVVALFYFLWAWNDFMGRCSISRASTRSHWRLPCRLIKASMAECSGITSWPQAR